MKMKQIYVAGPYTADNAFEVEKNIMAAKATAMEVCALGMNAFPVTPHLNTPHFEGVRDGDYFIKGTKELMLRCDAVLLVLGANCTNSVGTQGEIKAANEAGLPVFTSLLDLRAWVAQQDRKEEDAVKPSILEKIRSLFSGRTYSDVDF